MKQLMLSNDINNHLLALNSQRAYQSVVDIT